MKTKNLLIEICAGLLVLLWVYAAGVKLIEIEDFRRQIHGPVFPGWIADWLFFLVPFTEILSAFLLIFPGLRKIGFAISFLLMVAFTVYIGLVLSGVFERIPCSCGGVIKTMSWKVHFFFNLFFTAVAGV